MTRKPAVPKVAGQRLRLGALRLDRETIRKAFGQDPEIQDLQSSMHEKRPDEAEPQEPP